MARYKHIDTSPRFLAVDFERQLLPSTFELALNHLIDHQLDLTGFDARYQNDRTGASAYPPGMLLKVVLFAYSQDVRFCAVRWNDGLGVNFNELAVRVRLRHRSTLIFDALKMKLDGFLNKLQHLLP